MEKTEAATGMTTTNEASKMTRTWRIARPTAVAWVSMAASVVIAGVIAMTMMAATARADVVTSFNGGVIARDGSSVTQAGAHPFEATTSFTIATHHVGFFTLPTEQLKDAMVDLPPGFIGNPQAVPTCSPADFVTRSCPIYSQIGVAHPAFGANPPGAAPVFNIQPPPGVPAQFAFQVGNVIVKLNALLRSTGDYGFTVGTRNTSQALALTSLSLTLWGVPADPGHDGERGDCLWNGGACPSGAPLKAFLANPGNCEAGPLATTLRADSWTHPGAFQALSFDHDVNGTATAVTGCDKLPFDPSITAGPDRSAAGASTGLSVDLGFAQDGLTNPNGLRNADLKLAKVTLPAGMTINPSSADGLVGCSDSQMGFGNDDPVECPDGSRIGSVEAATPLLSETLDGGVFLGTQLSDDPQSGQMFRIFLQLANQERGVLIKLPGTLRVDPFTGQIQATFDNNPQVPVSDLKLQFNQGARAPLTNPPACGTYTVHSELTPWSSDVATVRDSSFVVDKNCDQAGKFEPSLAAGLANPRAGSSSPFSLTLSRPDGQQHISGLDVTLPPGVLANVGSVPLCEEDQAAAGTCDTASRVGSTTVAAGAGTSPLYIPQAGKSPTAVYLAGPYKGAPFSLSIVVPAQAGPFDLGTVVVRAALFVDPIDAHVTVKSDPIPTILKGVPLDIQKINVTMDRSGFMVAPTNCSPMQVGGQVTSSEGTVANVSSRFQVGDCQALAFRPSLALSLTGRGQTTDGKHPGVVADLRQPSGGANLKRVQVTLPLSLALDVNNANGLCEFIAGSKVEPECPKESIVGTATAVTPILNVPLTGPVYFVKNVRTNAAGGQNRTLPKLVIPLSGDGVKLTITGTSSVVHNHLVTTFDSLPDAPVSDFVLNIAGGQHGILAVSGAKVDICKATQIADQQADGDNGKQSDRSIGIATPCPLKVISKKVRAKTLVLKLGGLGAGTLTVSGTGLRKASRTLKAATVATIAVTRTGRRRPTSVRVSFDPVGPAQARSITIRIKR